MKIAIDSCIIFSILKGEPEPWLQMIIDCKRQGIELVVSNVVWAEVATLYSDERQLAIDLSDLGVAFEAINSGASFKAGHTFKAYRQMCGGPRKRILPDFLIGAHALLQTSLGLMTTDHGFQRSYFVGLKIVEPVV